MNGYKRSALVHWTPLQSISNNLFRVSNPTGYLAITGNFCISASVETLKTRFKDIHESEWNWVGVDVDYVVHNTGTIDDLQQEVDKFHSLFRQQQLTAI